MNHKWKRRKYIVDQDFQYTFIRKIVLLTLFVILGSLLALASVYYYYGEIQTEIVQPLPALLSGSLKVCPVPKSYSIFDLFWPVLAACIAVNSLFIIAYGVILSRHMAGPICRIRHMLDKMARYDLSDPPLHLREKDEFKPLLNDINNLKEQLRLPVLELQALCREMDADTLQKRQLSRIREIVSQFKTTA